MIVSLVMVRRIFPRYIVQNESRRGRRDERPHSRAVRPLGEVGDECVEVFLGDFWFFGD